MATAILAEKYTHTQLITDSNRMLTAIESDSKQIDALPLSTLSDYNHDRLNLSSDRYAPTSEPESYEIVV